MGCSIGIMQTSKTFTTPQGAKAITRAHKAYAVIGVTTRGVPEPVASVILRTDDLSTAIKRQRREQDSWTTRYSFIYVFRKADGARLTDDRCGSYRPSDPMWISEKS